MAELIVTQELQDYLVAQGVAQLPDATPSTTLPSVWLEPRDGHAYPRRASLSGGREGDFVENATITLIDTMLSVPQVGHEFLQGHVVDIVVVARNNATAKLLQRAIHGLVVGDGLGGRKLWTMHTLLVERSFRWRGDQPFFKDQYTYGRVQSILFECRTRSLAGLPYA